MRVRLTKTIQQPFAVQDVEGVVVGFDANEHDHATFKRVTAQDGIHKGEFVCPMMVQAVYVKLDDCDLHLLPPRACSIHESSSTSCPHCEATAPVGVMAIRPVTGTFQHFYDTKDKSKYATVMRTQIPLMPAHAVSLYSMQGTTADPGLVAYWFFPQGCDQSISWLIVYVMLSRPRTLAAMKSVNLSVKIRDIIEQGPPEKLVENFRLLFHDKIQHTHTMAYEALHKRIK